MDEKGIAHRARLRLKFLQSEGFTVKRKEVLEKLEQAREVNKTDPLRASKLFEEIRCVINSRIVAAQPRTP